MKQHDIIEISAQLKHETKHAFLLFDGKIDAWVPKSQAEDNQDGTFSMPEWLATEKGFI